MNPSIESLFSYLPEFLDNKLTFFWVIIFLMLVSVFYIRIKAGSAFIITSKFISIFMRKRSEVKKELMDDIIDIELFNFQYNTRAVSLKQKGKFEEWVRKYELDFRMMAKLKRNLDIETLKIKKIKGWLIIFLTVIFVITFLSMSRTLELAVKPAGWIKVEGSGWFWFNKDRAENYNFWGKSGDLWVITPNMCSEKHLFNVKLPNGTINTICSSFNKKRDIVYVSRVIKKQEYFFGGLSILSIILCFYTLSITLSLTNTYDVRKMILRKVKKYRSSRSYMIN